MLHATKKLTTGRLTKRPNPSWALLIVSLVCLFCARTSAQDSTGTKFIVLAGVLPERLPAGRIPYLATGDLYVTPGATVVVEPGVVMLFEAFTGLHVQGTLLARGTADKPVYFTSKNDKAFNPAAEVNAAPYDWNGIDLDETAVGTRFDHCTVRYSVYGIRSLTAYFRVNKATFESNGKSDVTIKGERQKVGREPYEYGVTVTDVKQQGVPLAIVHDPRKGTRAVVRYGGLSLGAGGAVVGVVGIFRLLNSQTEFGRINSDPGRHLTSPTAAADWEEAKRRRNLDRSIALTGAGLAVLGFTGFTISFFF